MTDPTTSALLESWVDVPEDSDFPIQNLPFGVFRTEADVRARVGVAIGEHILDLSAVHESGVMRLPAKRATFGSLNAILAMGIGRVRRRVSELLTKGNDELASIAGRGLVAMEDAELLLPVAIGDYVDFYSSIHHATNLGKMFRPDSEALLPNWRHIPIGYHGRASTIVVSGTDIVRPMGQRKPPDADPVYGPSTRLDIELEVGFFAGPGNRMGDPIPVGDAERHIAGIVLVNDWSARDIQAWEYQPLGPFLGKSFATTISPWVVTLEALAPYRVPAPAQNPAPLSYLDTEPNLGIDLYLEVELNGTIIVSTRFHDMYWTMAQQLAHAASNGTEIRPGDLYASGTVSGPDPGTYGSLIELTWGGAEPIGLASGETRTFLEDGDTVTLRGWCGGDGAPRIGLGECTGTVLPARR